MKCLLPYAVIEGMSGTAIYTYQHGTKVVGVAYGSQSQRVVASEIVEVRDGERHYVETMHRVVEFGLAHHVRTLVDFLQEVEVDDFVVSESRLSIPGLD